MLSFIRIKKNNKSHINKLFFVIKNRKVSNSISHKSKPSFNNHQSFVNQHPYRIWYLIIDNKKILGSFYLDKNNIIGLNLIKPSKKVYKQSLDFILKNFKPLKKVNSVRIDQFVINVSPYNKTLHDFLIENNFKVCQLSYII